jgi:hypothetical protein
MSKKILILSLGFALATLAACGNSNHPPKTKAASVAPVAADDSTQVKSADDSQNVVATIQPVGAQPNPNQIPHVGVAPEGEVAFGPAPPNSGLDPAGDAERQHVLEARMKQQQAMNRQQQTPPPAPAPATAAKNSHKQ